MNHFFRTSVFFRSIVFVVVYIIVAKLSLLLAFANSSASPVWPPTGMAIAFLAVTGWRAWPAVFIGAFVTNITTQGTLFTSLAIAGGNTSEALIGAWSMVWVVNNRHVVGTLFRFIVVLFCAAAPAAATLGVGSLWIARFV